jgi:phosphatidylglycerophosphatase A
MSLKFAFSSPWHVIATFFGSGVMTPAPGTWGSLAAALVFLAVNAAFPLSPAAWVAVSAAAFVAGAYASERTGRDIGVHDHGSIVIDEAVAVWLILATLPRTVPWAFFGFAAFRFFDIVKLPPARYFDTSPRWHNGWGVMYDDLAAAVQAGLALHAARLLTGWG